MRKRPHLISLFLLLYASFSIAQISFTNGTSLLINESVHSGVAMAISDMNNDGLDDIVRMDDANILIIEYQLPGGGFTNYTYGALPGGGQWAITIADTDENGFNDIVAGGFGELTLLKANNTGTAYTEIDITPGTIFVQGTNFVDINNDGTIDIFACHDNGLSYPLDNDGNGNFTHVPAMINTASTVPSDNSGNYGSVWTDYDNDGDIDMYLSKCRLGVSDPNDGRRLNMLFQNDGNNNFVDVAGAANLLPFDQSWATDFGDIDNDGDLDAFIINHENNGIGTSININNGDGTFTNITSTTGIYDDIVDVGIGLQVYFADFDNDGFLDILYTGIQDVHKLFKNNGDLTFTAQTNPFPTNLGIHSAALGDLNQDGYLDVYAGFATGFNGPSNNPDQLYLNESGTNNYFDVLLEATNGHRNGIGARVELYGAWGKQIREVRSGESYGIMNSMTRHFGIGSATTIDSLVIKWPSGSVDRLCEPSINQCLSFSETTAPRVTPNFSFIENELTLNFTDLTTGVPDNISWDFGDNTTSTDSDPDHTYDTYGDYTITLTANDVCGTHVFSQTISLINPLPVELIHFDGRKKDKQVVELNWQTASEKDFDFFLIERSSDGRIFESIGQKKGKGNSDGFIPYSFEDSAPLSGDNYYRLKIIDQDGDFEYSSIVIISIHSKIDQWKIYPNPTNRFIFIDAVDSDTAVNVHLYDINGKLLKSKNATMDTQIQFDMNHLDNGVYFIRIQDEERLVTKRIIKTN